MPQGMGYSSNTASFYPFMQGLEGGTPAASPSLFSVGAPGGTNRFDGMLGGAATSASSSRPGASIGGTRSASQTPPMFDLQALIAGMGSFSSPGDKDRKNKDLLNTPIGSWR